MPFLSTRMFIGCSSLAPVDACAISFTSSARNSTSFFSASSRVIFLTSCILSIAIFFPLFQGVLLACFLFLCLSFCGLFCIAFFFLPARLFLYWLFFAWLLGCFFPGLFRLFLYWFLGWFRFSWGPCLSRRGFFLGFSFRLCFLCLFFHRFL